MSFDENNPQPQSHSHQDDDSDEIRELFHRGSLVGDEETDAAIASFIDPALFDERGGSALGGSGGGHWYHHHPTAQQLIQPQLYQQGNFAYPAAAATLPPNSVLPSTSLSRLSAQQLQMWPAMNNMADPFAALMTASTAAAAMDSAAAAVEAGDAMATAAALAAADFMKVRLFYIRLLILFDCENIILWFMIG
jgi:hypothetical protein